MTTTNPITSAAAAYQRQLVLSNTTVLSADNLTAYGDLLCTEGHSGPLCAVCRDGYGRKSEGTCIKVGTEIATEMDVFVLICSHIGCGIVLDYEGIPAAARAFLRLHSSSCCFLEW
jgi:hypothetical protein